MTGSRLIACLEDVDDCEGVSGLSLSRADLVGAQADPAKMHIARIAKSEIEDAIQINGRSAEGQNALINDNEKPRREFLTSLRGFIGSSFDNSTFSFYPSEGQRLF